ncbi:MAG: haloacid dehalogenase [Anaerolineae bacterium]|nr:MAG: haloacid dehalogenase [Anaerolineae bacterium]
MSELKSLDRIGERILAYLDGKNAARDLALQRSRTLIRHCATAIRAAHRDERDLAQEHLQQAQVIKEALRKELEPYPDLYHAGYTQDALKEYAEASIVFALLSGEALPDPDDLEVEYAAYLGGLGEAAGELRRRTLDILRHDRSAEAERLLEMMDEIYGLLVTVDFPDAITGKLRRLTDVVRGIVERTRGDLTTSLQQSELKSALHSMEDRLNRES